jgi:LysR family hydrogen peroxide-inducible transcriptional activator
MWPPRSFESGGRTGWSGAKGLAPALIMRRCSGGENAENSSRGCQSLIGAAAMEMHEARYFLAVCGTMNLHRAAERCHITQPALSRSMQKLEAELGGHLFHRESTGVRLTEFGRLMRPHLEELVSRERTAQTAARSFLRLESAPLTLGVMCTIGPLRFVGFLNAFRQARPGVELSVVENVPARLSDMLTEGAIDVALMAQPVPFEARFQAEPIYRERFGLAFPVGHRFEQRQALHVADVKGETYLSRINCEYRDYLADLCRANGVDIYRGFRSEREDWIMAMVAAGMGICFLPEYSATHPGVRHRLVAGPEVSRDVSLVTMARRELSPAALTLIADVRAYDWRAPAAASDGES